jgi:hypothetical protein
MLGQMGGVQINLRGGLGPPSNNLLQFLTEGWFLIRLGKESQGVLTYEAQTGHGCVGCDCLLQDVTLMIGTPFIWYLPQIHLICHLLK